MNASPATFQPAAGYAHRGRSLAIDMLRGVAILLVLGRHYVLEPQNLGLLQPIASGWTHVGWAGVDLFFVLSGFLVSGLIFSEYRQRGAVDIRRFAIRRGFKIWPPYLAYLAVIAGWITWRKGSASVAWAELWPNVFHVQNYFHTPRVHTWSLAVEEHFYLAAALVFCWLLKPGRAERLRHLPAFVACWVLALAALRHVGFLREGAEALNLYATHRRCDGLLVGTLLAYWTHFQPEKLDWLARRPLWLMFLGLGLATPTLVGTPEASPWLAGIGLTGVYVGFALFVLGWLNVAGVHPWWRTAFARWPAALLGQIGFFSYSIYLWHVDLAQTPMRKAMQWLGVGDGAPAVPWTIATLLYVGLAVLTGMALARLFEIPSLALRDRLFPSAVKPLADLSAGKAAGQCAGPVTAESASRVTRASVV